MKGYLRISNGCMLKFYKSNDWRKSLVNGSQMSMKTHNKSKKSYLTILDEDLRKLEVAYNKCLEKNGKDQAGLIEGSKCMLIGTKKGTFIISKKHIFAYHYQALLKFGRKKLKTVDSNKESDSKTISHTCGTSLCCNPDHLVLETKKECDERVHCHYIMRNAMSTEGFKGIKKVQKYCNHNPKCALTNE